MTKDALETIDSMLADERSRTALLDSISIGNLLDDCIVIQRYRLPDALAWAVELTPLGDRIQHEVLAANRSARTQDVRFAIFLKATCGQGLLIGPGTDIEALRRTITQEIKERRILFPYIYGRNLHDTAAKIYPEKVEFDSDETVYLLKQLPVGVFQEGRFTVGPAGCAVSRQHRLIPARTRVPGYYCSDETCYDLHSISLQTPESSISKARGLVEKQVLRNYSGTDDLAARALTRSQSLLYNVLAIEPSEPMFDTLADSLTSEELHAVATQLLRNKLPDSELRKNLSGAFDAVLTNPADFIDLLDRPSILQLLLGFTDRDVVTAVDETVESRKIELEQYEIRSAKIRRCSAVDGRADIDHFGIRVRRGEMAEALFVLLHHLYFETGILEVADLEYSLEVEAGQYEVGELLELAVRRMDPSTLLRDLVFSQRTVGAAAAKFLGIPFESVSKGERIARALWKLGGPMGLDFGDLREVGQHRDKLMEANDTSEKHEVLRGHIANLFAAFESALQRSLVFTTWALTTDHFVTSEFEYDPSADTSVLSFIETYSPTENELLRLRPDGSGNTLAPLAAGFARLQKSLISRPADGFLRMADQIPMLCRSTPMPFAYPYTLPYWNLSSTSRQKLMIDLEEIAASAGHQTVVKVRNATVHGNHDFPDKDELRLAGTKIARVVDVLTRSGIFPQIYTKQFVETDKFGRARRTYSGDAGDHILSAPYWCHTPRLPVAPERMVIFTDAKMASAGALRFYIKSKRSVDSYWEGWPRRWATRAQGTTKGEPLRQASGGFEQRATG